ncbi:MAG: glycosyltransferase [Abitibacteriaceae bacterium]|nr:glycosyltransferase [Abditibacteriaceae bacterium]MBV9865927.1 glycosyltransferase [Abditibacteriaceae bacterium]
MNIAFFCDAYKPTHSGVAVSVATTAEELRRRGHRVVIFAPRYTDYEDVDEDVVRFPAGHWFRATDFPVAWPLLPRLHAKAIIRFRQGEFDVVHSHSPFIIGALGAHLARREGVPLVYTFHTLYHHYLHYAPLPYGFARSYTLRKVRRHCCKCDHVIAPSEPIEKIVHRLCSTVPTSVLPTGIDIERFAAGNREVVRSRYEIAENEIVLLYVGRLGTEKNLVFLLNALAPLLRGDFGTLNPKIGRIRLMLVGGGPAMDSLKELSRELHINSSMIFTDFIAPGSIADYYAAGDIFTFASRTETQGVSIAEALAAGLPCVVVGAMGAAQAITNGQEGFIVPPRETPFREAVARLIEDEALRTCMTAKARHSSLGLSRQHRVSQLLEIYQQLQGTKRPAVAAFH